MDDGNEKGKIVKMPFIACELFGRIGMLGFVICSIFIFGPPQVPAQDLTWIDQSLGLMDLDIQTIRPCPADPQLMLAASSRSIYLSTNHGYSWELVFRISGASRNMITEEEKETAYRDREFDFSRDDYPEEDLRRDEVLKDDESLDELSDSELMERLIDQGLLEEAHFENIDDRHEAISQFMEEGSPKSDSHQLRWDPLDNQTAFLATDIGLFRTSDGGRTWKTVGRNLTEDSKRILGIVVLNENHTVIIATGRGLRYSLDLGETFQPIDGIPTNQVYTDIEIVSGTVERIVAISGRDVYVGNLRQGFLTDHVSSGSGEDPISVAAYDDWIFASSPTKVFYRNTVLDGWNSIPVLELGGSEIRDISVDDTILYAATSRGVFQWDFMDMSGRYINENLLEHDVRQLALGSFSFPDLWIATRTGIFVLTSVGAGQIPSRMLQKDRSILPPYSDILAAALKNAELDLEYERKMIVGARKSSWLPEFVTSFQFRSKEDTRFSRNHTISISEGSVVRGPDNQSWSDIESEVFHLRFQLTWRPSLMRQNAESLKAYNLLGQNVKRRKDVMNSVNTLYDQYVSGYRQYVSIPSGKERILKKLELEKIKAQIDALTGFYLSQAEASVPGQ